MPIETAAEAKEKVRAWMEGRSIFIKETEADEVDFQLDGRTDTQIPLAIVLPKNLPKSVLVITKIKLHEMHANALNQLDPQEKADFIWNLKKDLIFAPATFTMEPSGTNLKEIQFTKEISFDELTDGRLINAMDSVCRCFIWTAWVFIKKFGTPVGD